MKGRNVYRRIFKSIFVLVIVSLASSTVWKGVSSEPHTTSAASLRSDESAQNTVADEKKISLFQAFNNFMQLSSSDDSTEKCIVESNEPVDTQETLQVARVYAPSPQSQKTLQGKKHVSSPISISKRIQIIVIGGILLAIGTIFVPTFLPQIHQSPGKFLHVVMEHSPEAGETMSNESPQPSGSYSLASDTVPNPAAIHQYAEILKNQEILEEKTDAQLTPPEETLSSPGWEQTPTRLLISDVKTFFQQSGFEFINEGENCWGVCSTHSNYERYGEIPVFIVEAAIVDESTIQEISNIILSQQHGKSKEVAFVIVNTPLHYRAYQKIYTYASQCDLAIIPLSTQLITKAIRNSTCAQTLEKTMSLAIKRENLYETHNPVENPLDFFGRRETIDTLLDAVSHLQHIGLFGLRKIGKTSLIWQLREQLSHHIVVYTDLQHVPQTTACLYKAILDGCIHDASCKYPDVTLPEFDSSELNDADNESVKFTQRIIKIWNCLKTKNHDIKVVLLLDEADHLVPSLRKQENGFPEFHQFVGIIRGISQQYGFLVSMMISSSPEISRIDVWKGQNNPGFQYYKEVFLSSLFEDECNQMISTIGVQMGLIHTEESLSRIYYETGGHPYVTRQLCSLIVKNLRTRGTQASLDDMTPVEVKDVENAVVEYIEYKSDYLESIWQRLPHIEQEILQIITTNDSCTLDDLITNEHGHHLKRERRKAISTLIENEIIEKCENKYSLRMGLLERFLLASN